MEDKSNEFEALMEEDLEMLPSGWGENDDFFNVDSWTGASSADEQKDSGEPQDTDDTTADTEEEGTTTAEDTPADSTEAETPTTQDGKGKIKFSATIDHEARDVELDESELPTIYQKAQNMDRVQARAARMQPIYDQATRTAKILGYASAEEMLKAAEDSYRDSEVEKLVSGGTQKEVAEDYVSRKMQDAAGKTEEAKAEEAKPTGRDFKAEVQDLLNLRPELRKPGVTLPDEVTSECIQSGRPLAIVYLEYEARQQKARYDAILKENKKLKQNADAASRAPVRGVSKGGRADPGTDDDPFLKGFFADD